MRFRKVLPFLAAVCALTFYGWRYSPLVSAEVKLPGNTDVLFLSYFAEKIVVKFDKLTGRLPNNGVAQPMYPVERPETYGESASLASLSVAVFRIAGLSMGASLFVFFLIVSIINHVAISRLVVLLTENRMAAFVAGFLPNISAFAVSNTDDPVMLLFAPLAWQLKLMYEKPGRSKLHRLYLSGGLLLFCLYWSSYVFLYQGILVGLWLFMLLWDEPALLKSRFLYLLAAILAIGLTPYILMHLRPALSKKLVSPWDALMIIRDCSLALGDLFRKPEGMYWFQPTPHEPSLVLWAAIRRTVYPGMIFLVLGGCAAVINARKRNFVLIGSAIFFLMLSLGPEIRVGGVSYPTPLGILGDSLGILKFHRIPLRAFGYFYLLLIVAIVVAFRDIPVIKRHYWLMPILLFSIGFETVNRGPRWYSYGKEFDKIPVLQQWQSEGKLRPDDVLLFLPSSVGLEFRNSDQRLYEYNREILYMLETARLSIKLVNGVHGYFPAERLAADRLIRIFEKTGDFSLLEQLSVSKVIITPDLALTPESWIFMRQIAQKNQSQILAQENNMILFNLK